MFGLIGLVVAVVWIKMDMEGHGYEHSALVEKKKIVSVTIVVCLTIAIVFLMAGLFS